MKTSDGLKVVRNEYREVNGVVSISDKSKTVFIPLAVSLQL